MDIKNLMGKLKTAEPPQLPPMPKPPQPVVEDSIQVQTMQMPQPPKVQPTFNQPSFTSTLQKGFVREDDPGVILDLGEGISLVIPVQKRMSLSDFLKIAEKVKALEMLSEEAEHRSTSPLYER
ncbi:MAG: hypothetical protein QXK37_04320 [Candidatus Woesearchaeota archaeon]